MTKKIWAGVAIFGLTVLAGTILAHSEVPLHSSPLSLWLHVRHLHREEWRQALSLNREQEASIKTIRRESWTAVAPLLKRAVDDSEALARYMVSPSADEQKALEQRRELLALQERIAAVRIHARFRILHTLSAEQRSKAGELLDERIQAFEATRPTLRGELEKFMTE